MSLYISLELVFLSHVAVIIVVVVVAVVGAADAVAAICNNTLPHFI